MHASAKHTPARYRPSTYRPSTYRPSTYRPSTGCRFGVLILVCIGVTGCIGSEQLKAWASPHVPCPTDTMEVTLTHDSRNTIEYDVACETGQVYECVSRAGSAFRGPGTKCEFIGSVELVPADDEAPAKQATPTVKTVKPVQAVNLSSQAWSRVRLDKCGASALMPQDTVVQDIVVDGTAGQFARTEIKGHEFAFFCFDFSAARQSAPAAGLARGMLDGMVESMGAELIRVRPSSGSLDFVMKVREGYHRGRVQVNDDWGYTTLVGPMQGLASKDIGKFVAGVDIGFPASVQP